MTGEPMPPWGVAASVGWRTCPALSPACNHWRPMALSRGMWAKSPSWLRSSQQARLSPSRPHGGEACWASALTHCSRAAAGARWRRNPEAFGSAHVSALGSRAGTSRACLARSRLVGSPNPLRLPVDVATSTRRQGCGRSPRCRSVPMAVACCAGVRQGTRSTPRGRCPGVAVPRRTAKALALHAWVSRCCQAPPFPPLPACIAFTRRSCSRRTVWWTRRQSLAGQSRTSWEAAPAGVATAVSCFASWTGWSDARVMQDQTAVGPLSRGGRCRAEGHPSPVDSRPPCAGAVRLDPQPSRHPVRSAFPGRRATG